MADGDLRAEWDELGQIDYLLNALARAVERRDIPRSSYDALAPRYVARRAEVVAILSRGAHPEGPEEPAEIALDEVQGTVSRETPAPEFAPTYRCQDCSEPVNPGQRVCESCGTRIDWGALLPPPSTGVVAQPVPVLQTPVAAASAPAVRKPRREPRPVPWTTILTFVGAFLVVIASAVFAVAMWEELVVGFRLAFLGVLTVAFYAVGELVRRRLNLITGGIALTAVGSAMLLLDGWIVIDGFDLVGPVPWAVVLLVCSAVYWLTEVHLAGGFFGAVGGAAQVVWWWLLGEGLGWGIAERMAGLAVVSVVWALAAIRARDNDTLAPLARVLRMAAPALAGLTVIGELVGVASAELGWIEILSAAVVGVAVTATFEMSDLLPKSAASVPGFGAQVPLFVAVIEASAMAPASEGWIYLGILAAMAAAYAIWELHRGDHLFGGLALVAELAAWMLLGTLLHWDSALLPGVFGTVAASWLAVSVWLPRLVPADAGSWSGSGSLRRVAELGGWIVLALSTFLVPVVSTGVPLTGAAGAASDVGVSLWLLALWIGAAWLSRHEVVGVAARAVTQAWSFWVLGTLLAWAAPGQDAALYALAFVVFAALWLYGRRDLARFSPLDSSIVRALAGAGALVAVLLGVAYEVASQGWGGTWQTALLLAASAAYWLLDTASANDLVGGILAPLSATAAVLVLTRWLGWNDQTLDAVFATTGLAWVIGSRAVDTWAPKVAARFSALVESTKVLGWAVLGLAMIVAIALLGGVPLAGAVVSVHDAALAGWLLMLLIGCVWVTPGVAQGTALVGWSFWTVAACLSWAAPGLHSAICALTLLVLAAAWLHSTEWTHRPLRVSSDALGNAMRIAFEPLVVGGIGGSAVWFRIDAWQTVALLAGGCVFWIADVVRGGPAWGLSLAAGLGVAAVGAGAWVLGSEDTVAMAAPACAILIVTATALYRQRMRALTVPTAIGALVAGTLAVFWASTGWPLSVSLLFIGVAWTIGAVALNVPECVGVGAIFGVGALFAALGAWQPDQWVVVTLLTVSAFALLAPSLVWARRSGFAFRGASASALVGTLPALAICVTAQASILGSPLAGWATLGSQDRVIGLLVLGVYAILGGWLYRLEWHLYEGSALILLAVWAEFWLVDVEWIQLYSTALAAYLVAMTYLYTSRAPDREVPLVVDIAAVVVGLGVPVALTIGEGGPAHAMGNALWAIGLALAAIGGGVAGKVRAYFFGGVFALVFTALFRSLSYLTEFWPITLGFIGIMMLVIALTWEWERALVKTTGRKVRETFSGWR